MPPTGPPRPRNQPPVFIMLPAGQAACRPGGSIPAMGTAVKTLGAAQFLTSLPCLALGVGALMFKCHNGYIVTGIWVGAFVLVSGVLGISAGSSNEQCPLSSYHMMSLINILAATALMTIQVLSVLQELKTCADATQTCPALCLTFDTLLFSLGLVHFFLALTSSILSISLNTKIAKRKEQVVPLIPYPLQYGHRSAMISLQGASEVPTSGGPLDGDVRLRDFDFNDEDFKFI